MLERKVALITGVGSGIGKSTAEVFLADGFAVVLAGRERDKLEAVAKAAGDAQALVVECDVTSEQSVRAMFAATRAKFGRLDVLFNNAEVFLADGFAVVLAGRERDKLEALAKAAGDAQALVVECDVTSEQSVRAMFAATRAKFGRLDVLFNN